MTDGKKRRRDGGGDRHQDVEMVDLILGYACNSSCIFCTATGELRTLGMTTSLAMSRLDEAFARYRPKKVRFGGGEPTVRRDLPALVRFASGLGVRSTAVQTNGYMLSYRDYAERLKAGGLGRVNISVRALNERTYSRLTGVPRAHALVERAVKNVTALAIPLELDVLLVRPVLPELEELTDRFLSLGVEGINYWFVSIEGRAAAAIGELVPTMTEASAVLKRIFERHPSAGLKSFYIPYCFFPGCADRVWHPISEKTLVITPNDSFMLERGRIDVGTFTPACKGCRYAAECFGVRENYLARFGDSEIKAVR